MTEHVTKAGARLRIGRVPRRDVDSFIAAHPMPEPPTRTVEAFAGVEEQVPVWDAPEYLAALAAYYVALGHDQIDLIAGAVEIVDSGELALFRELEELREIGLAQDDGSADLLRYVVLANDEDLAAVVGEVLYQSTVTARGIEEAKRAFDVTWAGEPLEAWPASKLPVRCNDVFTARLTAKFVGLTWEAFRELPGPEQSAHVAFYLLNGRLEWLQMQR